MKRVTLPKHSHRPTNRPTTKVYSLHILTRQLESLRDVQHLDGIAVAEQIRRGIDLWLDKQGAGR